MPPRTYIALSFAALAAALPARAAELEVEGAEAIVVTGHHDEYRIDATSSATKTGTALIDVPQSVAILSRDQMDDQAVSQLGDALRYVPGVILGNGEGNRDQVILRGQASTADFYLDGLRDDAQYYRPLYNTDRVEVLKGANALIFGRGGGGGVINRVTKAAAFDAASRSASAGADSLGAWSLAADVNQPLGEAAALRLNATYEDFANHRDTFAGHFIGAAPTLGVRLGDATTLQLAYEYAEDSRTADRGVPSLNGAPIAGYDRTFFGDPAINQSRVTAHIARARIEHALSDRLSANFTVQYATYDKYYGNVVPGVATATTVTLTGYNNAVQRRNWVGQGNLVWKTAALGLRHTVLAGFELSTQSTDSARSDARFANPLGAATASALVPLAQRLTIPAVTFTAPTSASRAEVRTTSAYLQDQIEIGDHLQIIGGMRYDDFRIATVNRLSGFITARSDGKWSPRLGIVIKPQANLSLFASYAKSFLPQAGDQSSVLTLATATLAPEAFRNLEAGIKWDPAPGLSLSTAAFQVDRANTRVSDPANAGFFLLGGKSRVRGFEAALGGRITAAWQINLGYSHQTGEIRSPIASGTTTIPAGRALDKLPRHQFSAWSRYDLSDSFGLGLGLVHQSSQFASISNAVRLPGFARLDAAVFYKVSPQVSLQFNVENLTDAAYYPSANSDANIATGKPINGRLTARVKF